MLDTTNQTKGMLDRLARATAAPHEHELKAGKAPNPFSAVHWLLDMPGSILPASELSPRTYRVRMQHQGKVIGEEQIKPGECRTQDEMDELVSAMFDKYAPKQKAAA